MLILTPEGISNYTNYTLYFTYSYRNERIPLQSLNGNVVLDTNGTFYSLRNAGKDNITIAVVGGIDKFVHQKSNTPVIPFFITRFQKIALYKLIKAISTNTEDATFDCENQDLQIMIDSLYQNYTG